MDNRVNPLSYMQSQDPQQSARDRILAMVRQNADNELTKLKAQRPQSQELNSNSANRAPGQIDPARTPQGPQNFQPSNANQPKILDKQYAITQQFGNKSDVEKFSGGIHYGTDFATPENTPIALPEGDWIIDKVLVNDPGYGNSILAVNRQTGETLRFSHLNRLNVNPGQNLQGSSIIGYTGNTGNSTGPHLDIEYRNKGGQASSVLESPYASYLY